MSCSNLFATSNTANGIVNQNLKPALGAVLLTKLKPAKISEAYSKALVGATTRKAAYPHAPSGICTAF